MTNHYNLSPIQVQEICKSNTDKPVVMLVGFGSAAKYFLEYFLQHKSSFGSKVIVVCRNKNRVQADINVIRLAASLRTTGHLADVEVFECDVLLCPERLQNFIKEINPSIVINFTRFITGVKYGSKSWDLFKAYGFWSPLSAVIASQIAKCITLADVQTMYINTSYPDAVNPFIVQNGFSNPIFGAGNVNHIIPRFKDALLLLWNTHHDQNSQLSSEDIKVIMTTSHYHDVLIGKEGVANEDKNNPQIGFGLVIGSNYAYNMREEIDKFCIENFDTILSHCNVEFPAGQVRNMMVASSAFQIVTGILEVNAHDIDNPYFDMPCVPGFMGELGGYPVAFSSEEGISSDIDDDMREINKRSILNDGIAGVEDGCIIFDVNGEKYKKFEENYCTLPERMGTDNLIETVLAIREAMIGRDNR